ncbi:hypothetical protein [Spirosoma sp.]|uniref:hypothetical protein n=1 Tax=Spirosoma sp. TaxID=1899569 RepID=UPI0026314AF9|nr:hypothetical protein [Spirosoma sp.]MCX6212971.1 hypothetical protein [Spirosoma sp.]
MNYARRGADKPLLLIHGLGSSLKVWDLIVGELAIHQEVIALDLPVSGSHLPWSGRYLFIPG